MVLEDYTRKLFKRGSEIAASRGLILVDTKYEFGLRPDGELVLIDEMHTPDSSRYWFADSYEKAMTAGEDPRSLDKEFLRRWLVSEGFRGEGPPPALMRWWRAEFRHLSHHRGSAHPIGHQLTSNVAEVLTVGAGVGAQEHKRVLE